MKSTPQHMGSGADLARETQRQLVRAAVFANCLGAVTVFTFGSLAPGLPDSKDVTRLAVANAATFVVFMLVALPVLIRRVHKACEPIERWLSAERPATAKEQEAALLVPSRVARLSVGVWAAAAVVFPVLSATYSLGAAASDAVVVVLGGAVVCALVYLLAERAMRPAVARALAGSAPSSIRGPSVTTRLTTTWALVTGVPLLGIAAIVLADLAGAEIDTLTTVSMLFLALAGFGIGLAAMVLATQAVADPLFRMEAAMASVERGDFDARVRVEDGSEVGRLQSGFNRMASGLAERERMRDLFGRHVGREVAKAALDGAIQFEGEDREVAVLFVDLIGSTSLAAHRPATEVVALLNSFFRLVVMTIERHDGLVNKFQGDAALCVFGAPLVQDDPAGECLAAARELRDQLVSELPELDAGIGVSAGWATAGHVGAEHRFEYTVIGDPVNEAARLCEIAKQRPERVLASDAALRLCGDVERGRWLLGESVELRGRAAPTRLVTPADAR